MRLLLVLFVLLVPSLAEASDFIGAQQCGACHEKEYKAWKRTGHAAALARLTKRQAADAACRGCHTTAPDIDDPKLAGVQCESCHGAGKLYAPEYVMRDVELSKLFGLEPVTVDTCRPCHQPDAPSVHVFSYEKSVQRVNHKPAQTRSPEAEPRVEPGS